MQRFLAVAVFFICSFTVLTIGYAAQTDQRTQGQPPTQQSATQASEEKAGQSKQFTNIQVLKDIPADQLLPSMQFISAALGVDCGFCHITNKGHEGFASDDKRNKKTAREMMTMTMAINQNNFNGQQRVTCASCHNGHNEPNPIAPVMDDARWQERADARTRAAAQNRSTAPAQNQQQPEGRPNPQAMQAAADAIIAKYVDAVGGQAAIEKLTSLSEKGTITTPHGDSAEFQLEESAPNRVLFVRTPANGPAMRVAYNGQEAAATIGDHANPIHGFELQALKLDANFFRNFNLKQQYTRTQAPPFTQNIDGREVKMVRGLLPDNQGQETLYFDSQSGLLVRRVTVLRTALGGIPQQYDYSDYRDVKGVKIPFVTKVSTPENIQTRTIKEAKFNVPVNEKDFSVPAANAGASSGGN
jgi:hypothetical protein